MNTPMRTKITVPRRRSDIVHRERLFTLLSDYLDYKLIMVTAPAGYGKTTLLLDYVHEEKIPTCWYSLDEYDQDLYRFLSHFIAAISVQFRNFGQQSLMALKQMGADQINLEVITNVIVNDLYDHVDEHFLFVIDDFHLVEQEEFDENGEKVENPISNFIMHFLDYVDENCHLVILSRTLLGLRNLPKMIMRNEVTGLSFSDLAFTEVEAETLIENLFALRVEEKYLKQIMDESEGWVTGLILTASSQNENGLRFTKVSQSTGIDINEYWGRQILDRESDEMRSFLLYTSLLEEFNVDLCHQVLDDFIVFKSGVDSLMDEAFKKSLFLLQVPDERSGSVSLRFHHLFRDFLQKRINEEEPERTRRIRLKLADVIANRKDWERAAKIYFSLGENEKVAQMMIDAGTDLITEGKFKLISTWLEKLTGEIREKYPVLLSIQGASAIMHKEVRQGIEALSQAIEIFKNDPSLESAYYEALSRRATGFSMVGEWKNCQKDLDLINQGFDKISNYKTKCTTYINQGQLFLSQNKLDEAFSQFSKADQLYFAYGDLHSRAVNAINLGMIQAELGQYEEAERNYQESIKVLEKSGNEKHLANLYNNLAVLLHLQGKYAQAAFYLEKAIQTAKYSEYFRFVAYALAGMGDLYVDIGAFLEANRAYAQAEEILNEYEDSSLLEYLLKAKVKLWIRANDIEKVAYSFEDLTQFYEEDFPDSPEIQLLENEVDFTLRKNAGKFHRQNNEIFLEHQSDTLSKQVQAELLVQTLVSSFEIEEQQIYNTVLDRINLLLSDQSEKYEILSALKRKEKKLANLFKQGLEDRRIRNIQNQVERFGEDENEVRKRIRQHVSSMPLPRAIYEISVFGNSTIKIDDQIINNQDWQATVARDLFLFLLANNEGVTKDQIKEALWSNMMDDDLSLRLKNTLYRMRRVLGREAIVLENNRYYFNRDLDYEYDVERFEYLWDEILFLSSRSEIKKKLSEMITLYRGPYLQELDYMWVIIERERLHIVYRSAVQMYTEELFRSKQYAESISVLKQLLKYEPEFEEAHRYLMRAYSLLGDPKSVLLQYQQCEQILKENLQITPSDETQDLLRKLIRKL